MKRQIPTSPMPKKKNEVAEILLIRVTYPSMRNFMMSLKKHTFWCLKSNWGTKNGSFRVENFTFSNNKLDK
jgi:hypothetical protein